MNEIDSHINALNEKKQEKGKKIAQLTVEIQALEQEIKEKNDELARVKSNNDWNEILKNREEVIKKQNKLSQSKQEKEKELTQLKEKLEQFEQQKEILDTNLQHILKGRILPKIILNDGHFFGMKK